MGQSVVCWTSGRGSSRVGLVVRGKEILEAVLSFKQYFVLFFGLLKVSKGEDKESDGGLEGFYYFFYFAELRPELICKLHHHLRVYIL